MTDDRAEIEQLYREYWRCMIEKDVGGLRAMMADDYCLTHMTGTRQSADEFLRGLSRGTAAPPKWSGAAVWRPRSTAAANTSGVCAGISPCGKRPERGSSSDPKHRPTDSGRRGQALPFRFFAGFDFLALPFPVCYSGI